jgi:hypothetical protein
MAASITPTNVERDGGYKITLTGLTTEGIADGAYFFHVGSAGTYADPKAYAGSYGNGSTVTVVGGSGSFVSPPIKEPGAYSVTAYPTSNPSGVGAGVTLASGIGYTNQNYKGSTYTFRALQPSWANTGARNVEEEESQ